MSNFWTKTLGGAVPAPAQQASPVMSRPFWDLTSPSVHSEHQAVVQAPSMAPATLPSKALSARLHDTCPNCMSDKYFRPSGVPNAMFQCAECGHNARFEQMAMGAAAQVDGGPATPARQVASAHTGVTGTVVGKVTL